MHPSSPKANLTASGRHVSFASLQKLSDEELISQLAQGCDDALAVLFDRYHRLVLSIALKIVRDPGEAEDVLQTVFFDIYRAAAQFDPSKGSTKVWVLQYAYHRSINRRKYLGLRGFFDHAQISELEVSQPEKHNGSTGALTTQEAARLVREGLATLNRSQRTALELAFFEGLSMAEIAQRTKESIGNVRHHYYRGLARLRACILQGPSQAKKAVEVHGEAVNVRS